jgi:hypothetical protein
VPQVTLSGHLDEVMAVAWDPSASYLLSVRYGEEGRTNGARDEKGAKEDEGGTRGDEGRMRRDERSERRRRGEGGRRRNKGGRREDELEG